MVFLGIAGLSAVLFFTITLPNLRKKQAAQEAERAQQEKPVPQSVGQESASSKLPNTETNQSGKNTSSKQAEEPSQILENVAKGLLDGKPEVFLEELGAEVVPPETLTKLNALLGPNGYEIDPTAAVAELGRQPNLQRWALKLRKKSDHTQKAAIELDFNRLPNGLWAPYKVRLPGEGDSAGQIVADAAALDTALTFIQAVMKQDFPVARKFVDHSRVNDATIAGLCILFEEGAFTLKKDKPLIATVAKPNVSWFLAQVTSDQLQTESRFGMVMQRTADKPWLITEINLDRILSVYASRFGEGDVYYTPLVRNPQGGDSVVLYFAYNSGELHPRTKRQIEIVSNILKADAARKLKIWGHTDAKGTEDYNRNLSRIRAEAVRDQLITFGVPPEQVSVEGFGASRPRRANFNADGSDNPEGRRVNRRAEIYLDF